jgi:hypothetical protein
MGGRVSQRAIPTSETHTSGLPRAGATAVPCRHRGVRERTLPGQLSNSGQTLASSGDDVDRVRASLSPVFLFFSFLKGGAGQFDTSIFPLPLEMTLAFRIFRVIFHAFLAFSFPLFRRQGSMNLSLGKTADGQVKPPIGRPPAHANKVSYSLLSQTSPPTAITQREVSPRLPLSLSRTATLSPHTGPT